MANVVNTAAFGNVVANQLKTLSARHEILSNNITNATTPGYKATDVRLASNFKELVSSESSGAKKKLPLTVTSSRHLSSSAALSDSVATVKQSDVEEKPNGNNVSLPGEALRLVQNQHKYEEAINIYNSANGLLKSVIGKDGGQ